MKCVNATKLRHFVVKNSQIEDEEVSLRLVLWQSTAVQQGSTSVQQLHLSRGLDRCYARFSIRQRKHGMLDWCHDCHTSFITWIATFNFETSRADSHRFSFLKLYSFHLC